MKNEKYYVVIALLAIAHGEPLNNSYKIMQLLEWRFKILDCRFIFDLIEKNGFASFKIKEAVHYYNIEKKGEQFVAANSEESFKFLINAHPVETVIIEGLFKVK